MDDARKESPYSVAITEEVKRNVNISSDNGPENRSSGAQTNNDIFYSRSRTGDV